MGPRDRVKPVWPPDGEAVPAADVQAALAALTERIAAAPADAALYKERGRLYMQAAAFGPATNDFLRAAELDPADPEAQHYLAMLREIIEFRHIDIYNP